MELEQLKQEWQLLNNKVEKVELRNRQLTQEIMGNKLKSQFQILMSYDRFWFICALLIIPFLAGIMLSRGTFTEGSTIWMCSLVFICALWQGYMLLMLKKIQNKEQSIIKLTIDMQRYQIYTKTRFIAGLVILVIMIVGLYLFERNHMEPVAMLGGFIGGTIGGTIGVALEVKHLRNISSYMNTLHELKEDYQ